MYCGGTNPSISHFFLALDQHLLSKKIVSKLKVSVIRQTNTFSLNNWKFLIFYIVSFKFPGIPGNSRTDFREIPVPGNENLSGNCPPYFLLELGFAIERSEINLGCSDVPNDFGHDRLACKEECERLRDIILCC